MKSTVHSLIDSFYISNTRICLTGMDVERCKKLVNDIRHLSQVEVEEIFKIIHESKCGYTRNNNGIFVNLAWLDHDIIDRVEKYVCFCTKSQTELTKYESLCDVLNHKMHDYNQVDVNQVIETKPTKERYAGDEEKVNAAKASSSMRYYLLKKRYAKQQTLPNTYLGYLNKDIYIVGADL